MNIIRSTEKSYAIDLIKNEQPELILVNYKLSKKTDENICRLIKSNALAEAIPVIFLVKSYNNSVISAGFKEGCIDFLVKPINVDEAFSKIKTHLTIRRLQIQLADTNVKKDRFFSIISHDLRSPFMALIGLSDILSQSLSELTKTEIKELAQKLSKTTRNTYSLLENLLEWSHLQKSTFEPGKENFDLYILCKKVIDLFQQNAVEKDIKLNMKIGMKTEVFADENMIYAILRNLVANAIKFTNKSGNVTLSSRKLNNFVEVSVADNGIGISQQNIKKLFRIDMNFTSPGTANERGTGLGLLLCKELVEQNGGKIWVVSKPGKGSTFKFTLPKFK